MTVKEATEAGGAYVTFATPEAIDTFDASLDVTCVPASGTVLYAVGIHTVDCSAVDDLGNESSCQLTVKVTGIKK